MRELLDFLLTGILGKEKYEVAETTEESHTNFVVSAKPGVIGMIIGKGGKTVRTIRNLLKVRATLEQKGVSVSVEEKA